MRGYVSMRAHISYIAARMDTRLLLDLFNAAVVYNHIVGLNASA